MPHLRCILPLGRQWFHPRGGMLQIVSLNFCSLHTTSIVESVFCAGNVKSGVSIHDFPKLCIHERISLETFRCHCTPSFYINFILYFLVGYEPTSPCIGQAILPTHLFIMLHIFLNWFNIYSSIFSTKKKTQDPPPQATSF